MKNLLNVTRLSAAGVASLCILGTNISFAASVTWSGAGGDDNWSTGANWGGTAPNTNDLILFSGTTRLTPNNNLTTDTVFNNIMFISGAGAFTVSGNALAFNYSQNTTASTTPFGGGITNSSANSQTVSLPTEWLPGDHVLVTTAAGALNLSGTFSRSNNAVVLFTTNGSTANINLTGSGLANDASGILGGWATLNVTNWAALSSGNVVPYTGFNLNPATIPNTPSSNVKLTVSGAAGATTTINNASAGTSDINSLMWQPATASGNETVNVGTGNTLRLGAKGAIFAFGNNINGSQILTIGTSGTAGTLTAGGAADTAGEITLYNAPYTGTRNNLVINSVIADNGLGKVSVNVHGYLQLNNIVHTYSGGTYIHRGRAQANGTNVFGSGPVYVYPGGQAFLNSSGFFTNDFYIAGFGNTERASGNGAIRASTSRTNTGIITLMADAGLGGGNYFGPITGTGNLTFGWQDSGGTVTFNMTTPNSYTGDTIILANANAASTGIKMFQPNVMTHGAGKGNLVLNAQSATIVAFYDLNGNSQTINGLSNTVTSVANNFVTNSVATPATLTIGDGDATATYGGLLAAGTGVLNITKIGNGTQTFTNANTYTGATTVSAGKLFVTTAATGAGSYSVGDGATLKVSRSLAGAQLNMSSLTLGTSAASTLQADAGAFALSPTVPIINISGALTLNGPVTLNLLGTALTTGTFALINYGSEALNANTITLVGSPRVVASLNDDNAGHITVTITALDTAIKWDGASSNWNINNSGNLNWKGVPSGVNTYYIEDPAGNDAVRFDNTATGTTTVNLTTTLTPVSVTVSNPAVDYVFNGSGKITGATGLVKQDTGKLTIDNSSSNDFTGGVTISGGTVQVGNNDANGNLPSVSIANSGSLIYNRSDTFTVSSVISGSGSLTKNANGILTLAGASSYGGTTTINAGKVIVNNASGATLTSSLGAIPGGAVTVVAGATLDIQGPSTLAFTNNNGTPSAKQFNIAGAGTDGNGAIVNNGAIAEQAAFQLITLTGDATFGGVSRWDMRGNASLVPQLNLAGFKLTKTNANQISLVGANVTDGTIQIDGGLLSFETGSVVPGPGTITVNAGASIGHFRQFAGLFTKPIILNGGTFTNAAGNGATNDSTITLTADSTMSMNAGSGHDLYLRGPISGSFGFTKIGSQTLLLSGTNTYGGNTVVSGGSLMLTNNGSISNSATINVSSGTTLSAQGRTDGTLWLSSGQTLKGNGTVIGTLNLASGSTLAPGASVGALTQTGPVNLQSGATNVVEVIGVSNSAPGVGYDTLTASGAINVQSTSGNPFRVKLISFDGTGVPGAATNFDNTITNYAWTFLSGSSVSGYAANKFAVDESGFANALGGAHFVVKSTATALQVALDHAPGATAAGFNRNIGATLKIAIADLVSHWSDADADPVTFVSVAPTSANSFALSTDGTNIFYTGADNQNDSFTYTITDGFLTGTGTVNITAVAAPPAPASANQIVTDINGVPTITFAGIPGRTNITEASTNLTDWAPISTNVAGTNGLWQVIDTDATNYLNRFYRSYTPYP